MIHWEVSLILSFPPSLLSLLFTSFVFRMAEIIFILKNFYWELLYSANFLFSQYLNYLAQKVGMKITLPIQKERNYTGQKILQWASFCYKIILQKDAKVLMTDYFIQIFYIIQIFVIQAIFKWHYSSDIR